MNIVFFDGECGLCDLSVRFLLKRDKKNRFLFAPLQGETAKKHQILDSDSVALLEEEKTLYREGEAALRILWLLGGAFTLPGSLYFLLPKCVVNGCYRVIAKNRHFLFSKEKCTLPETVDPSRFIP